MSKPFILLPSGITYRLRKSSYGGFLRRYGGIYRTLAGITDKTIATILLAVWGIWAFGGLFMGLQVGRAAWRVGMPLAILLLYISVVLVGWWMQYRYSTEQTRHSLLGRRGVVAQGREVSGRVGANTVLRNAAILRPGFTARANISRAYALAPIMFRDHVNALINQATARGIRLDAEKEAAICEHIVSHYRRTATAYQAGEQ